MKKSRFLGFMGKVLTLFFVSIIAFGLMRLATGDVLMEQLKAQEKDSQDFSRDIRTSRRNYAHLQHKYGVDKPSFYFSVQPNVIPDNLFSFGPKYKQSRITRTCLQHGSKKKVEQLEKDLDALIFAVEAKSAQGGMEKEILQDMSSQLESAKTIEDISYALNALMTTKVSTEDDIFYAQENQVKQEIAEIEKGVCSFTEKWPKIRWHGSNNQYHEYMVNLLGFNWGTSLVDGRKVSQKISGAIVWTFILSLISILVIFLISIPLGVYLALHKNSRLDNGITAVLFFWKVVPIFWLATLFVIFLTSDYYSPYLDIFEGPGLGNASQNLPFLDKFIIAWPHLILPLICMIMPSLAYLTQQMKIAFLTESSKEYVLAARAQGVRESKINWRYILPNALFPIFTLMGNILPALISGSLVVEIIFNIPGMGRLAFDAVQLADWRLLNVIVMITALLTILGYGLSDTLYYIFDPRLRQNRSR